MTARASGSGSMIRVVVAGRLVVEADTVFVFMGVASG